MEVAPGSGHQVNIPVPVKPHTHALLTVQLHVSNVTGQKTENSAACFDQTTGVEP